MKETQIICRICEQHILPENEESHTSNCVERVARVKEANNLDKEILNLGTQITNGIGSIQKQIQNDL
jgi:hypothetical protein